MSNYVIEAKKFLEDCNATMQFMYLGTEVNKDWNETKKRDTYMVNIRTPLGNMQVKFWDSIVNTLKNNDRYLSGLKKKIQITEYDVLSCLQKYDVGDILGIAISVVCNAGRMVVQIAGTICNGIINLIQSIANGIASIVTLNKTCKQPCEA